MKISLFLKKSSAHTLFSNFDLHCLLLYAVGSILLFEVFGNL